MTFVPLRKSRTIRNSRLSIAYAILRRGRGTTGVPALPAFFGLLIPKASGFAGPRPWPQPLLVPWPALVSALQAELSQRLPQASELAETIPHPPPESARASGFSVSS